MSAVGTGYHLHARFTPLDLSINHPFPERKKHLTKPYSCIRFPVQPPPTCPHCSCSLPLHLPARICLQSPASNPCHVAAATTTTTTTTTTTQILSSIARTGAKASAPSPSSSSSAPEAVAADWSPVSAAHQQDVGVVLPMLAPGLGLPVSLAEQAGGGDSSSGDNVRVEREKPPRLLAMKALATFSWPAPPSLCHSGRSTDAAEVVHAMACLGEAEGQAALISALEKWVGLGWVGVGYAR